MAEGRTRDRSGAFAVRRQSAIPIDAAPPSMKGSIVRSSRVRGHALSIIADVQKELRSRGASATLDKGPEDMANYIKSQTQRYGTLLNALGVKAQ